MSIERNELFDLAFRFMTETQESVFLTGKAGTGKTTFLKYLRDHSTKNMVVSAPTGVAAINAGGVTLHSLFQLPFHPFLPTAAGRKELVARLRFSRQKQQLLRKMELLVIDEISMVRCDVLDAIDTILRSIRRQPTLPFGGVQLLCIGDLYQLPPVAQAQEWQLLQEYYVAPYFFDSYAAKELQPLLIELTTIYRQKEESFVGLLNKVRNNEMAAADFNELHQRYLPGFKPPAAESYITLTTHNLQADRINERELEQINAPLFTYPAQVEGDFPESSYPADANLRLRKGAQVMFLKNDAAEKKYFNGKIGTVSELSETSISVLCEDGTVQVKKESWSNIRYTLNRQTEQLEEEVLGNFEQYPLRLAWAVTIHKSQGLTFERVMIDAAAAFSSGQVYVALSRCTRLEGLVLLSRIPPTALISNEQVVEGQQKLVHKGSLAERFNGARQAFTLQLLEELFGWEEPIRTLRWLNKQVQQHREQVEAAATEWLENTAGMLQQLQQVGQRFLSLAGQQLQQHMIEENTHLQQRITDAASYFKEQLHTLQQQLQQHPIRTEHREAATAIDEALVALARDYHLLSYLLQYPSVSFSVTGYLQHKLRYTANKPSLSSYAPQHTADSNTAAHGQHPELLQQLRRWRDGICNTENLPVYMVANSETLQEICRLLPQTPQQLQQVKGLGAAKVKRWGEVLLEIVQDYCNAHDIQTPDLPLLSVAKKEKKSAGRKQGPSTLDQSLELLQQGNTLAAVAATRKLAISTIEGHALDLIKAGKLEPGLFVQETLLQKIQQQQQAHPEATLTELKQLMGTDCGFFELRVAAWVQQQQVAG